MRRETMCSRAGDNRRATRLARYRRVALSKSLAVDREFPLAANHAATPQNRHTEHRGAREAMAFWRQTLRKYQSAPGRKCAPTRHLKRCDASKGAARCSPGRGAADERELAVPLRDRTA